MKRKKGILNVEIRTLAARTEVTARKSFLECERRSSSDKDGQYEIPGVVKAK